jgi:hypothetical protein
MKGTKQIEINGEKVTLRFTTGVVEDLKEYADQNGLDEQELEKIKHQRIMLALMELYGTEDEWMSADILDKAKERSVKYKSMDFQQMMDVVDSITSEVGDIPKAEKKKKK